MKENSQSITPTYFFATLRDSNTILCTNSQTLYTEGLERLRRRLRFHECEKKPRKEKLTLLHKCACDTDLGPKILAARSINDNLIQPEQIIPAVFFLGKNYARNDKVCQKLC